MIRVAVADLEALLAQGGPLPPRLAALLARADCYPLQTESWQAQLLTDQALAAAALTRRQDRPDDADGPWLRADPVSLLPDLNAVWIRPGAALDCQGPAFQELKALFAEAGLRFDLPHPQRGYLRLDAVPDCRFQPPASLAGESLDRVMPSGPDAARWRRLLNDSQIILHQHRDPTDSRTPGGLWFWGAGQLPSADSVHCDAQGLLADGLIWQSLADFLALPCQPFEQAGVPADGSLVEWPIDPSLDAAANLQALDAWLAPIWARLRRGGLNALVLGGPRRAWRITPRQAWAFWRRRPPEMLDD